MNIWQSIRKFIAERKAEANLVELVGEILLFVVLVPVIAGLVSGLVNASTGVAATIYGLTTTILAIIFFYVLYRQIKGN